MMMNTKTPCPCGAAASYTECCQPLHQGTPAASPEALMRSRYSAFAMGDSDYLLASWHPHTRPTSLQLEPDVRWRRLVIHEAMPVSGDAGVVRFTAISQQDGQWHQLTESSRFMKVDGYWRYHQGDAVWVRLTPGRNDHCPCGSGRKLKHCCIH